MTETEMERRRLFEGMEPEAINRSLGSHKSWRTQYATSVKGRVAAIKVNATPESARFLQIEWDKYSNKCSDIEAGFNLLMGLDPSRHDNLNTEINVQSTEYNTILNLFNSAMAMVVKPIMGTVPAPNSNAPPEPKIKKEHVPDLLTKDTTPLELRRFLRDFKVYYKESFMERASLEGLSMYGC